MAVRVPSTDDVTLELHHFGGEGPPLLVVHATGFCAAPYRHLLPALGGTFEVWALDVRSHGDATDAADGEVRAFTIVNVAAPGVPVPYVSAIVDCQGTSVRANLVNVEPSPDHVHLGMKVRLATYSLGLDSNGLEAIGFGFEPIS